MVQNNAKVQHYVPQFLLRKFGIGKKDQLHVFDKQTSKSFTTNIKNVASESRFYDFQLRDQSATLEPAIAQLESSTKPLLERVLQADSVAVLTEPERTAITAFLAVQLTRTRAFREQVLSLPQMLAEQLRSRASSPDEPNVVSDYITIPSENELKIQTVRFMTEAPVKFGPYLMDKVWFLASTSRKAPFIIGDHPLALQNSIDMSPCGNLGLGVRGIEIYLPLSPTRALVMWCTSHREAIVDAVAKLRTLKALAPQLIVERLRNPEGLEQMDRAMRDGSLLPYSLENVRNFNSLQVLHAERFVFSSSSDFSLPTEVINSHPATRQGMRATFS